MEIIHANTLKAEDVRKLTEQRLREHLSFEVEGYRLSTSMVLNVLLKAAIENRSKISHKSRGYAQKADIGQIIEHLSHSPIEGRIPPSEFYLPSKRRCLVPPASG